MISTRRKEAELQYIKARQNHTLALQKLNILMGSEPDAPIDSIAEIDIPTASIIPLGLDDVLLRRAEYASTSVNIARSEAQRHAALSRYNPQVNMFLATGWDTGITYKPPTESLYRHTEAATKLCNGQYSGRALRSHHKTDGN